MPSRHSVGAALILLYGCGSGGEIARSPASVDAPGRSGREQAGSVSLPPEAGTQEGPAGTSGMGATRYDQVGYASWYGEELGGAPTASGMPFAPDAITAAHRTLPLGSHAEVTALDTGRTILVLINDRGPGRADREIDLSRGAAALLGMDGRPSAPVRVRGMVATPADAAALAAGRPAGARLDAPPVLLAALRSQLRGGTPRDRRAAAARPRAPVEKRDGATARRNLPPPPLDEADGYLVQVAAFSTEQRARNLADVLHGRVERAGDLYRVRLGPFADAISAERARDGAARRGYGDATIIVQP